MSEDLAMPLRCIIQWSSFNYAELDNSDFILITKATLGIDEAKNNNNQNTQRR